MSKMITLRLREDLLSRLDRERRRAGLTRAAAINEAVQLWMARRQHDEAVESDQQAYDRHPVTEDEFAPVLGAQKWPK
jgi:metal-responsive CopG/Arc/MetJ family transcriptional regulator